MNTNFERQTEIKKSSMFRAITEVLRSRVLFFFLCGSLSFTGVYAHEFDRQYFDLYLSVLDSAQRCMVSVAVQKNGEPVYSSAIGYADAQQGIQATGQSSFRPESSVQNVFEYSEAQLKLTFHPEKDVMVLEQGRRFEMHRN